MRGNNDPEDVEQDEAPPPPKRLVDAVGQWLDFSPPGNDLNTVTPRPLVVPRTADAKAIFGDLLDQQREARRHDDPVHRALWGRAVQKASQLALIYACSKHGPDERRLRIDQDGAVWACEVVRHATKRILYLASKWIADDEFHDKQNEVVRYVQEQGGAVKQNKITRRFHRWSIRVRSEVLQNLLATGQLIAGKGPQTGRGTWYYTPAAYRQIFNEPSTNRHSVWTVQMKTARTVNESSTPSLTVQTRENHLKTRVIQPTINMSTYMFLYQYFLGLVGVLGNVDVSLWTVQFEHYFRGGWPAS